MTVSGPFTIGGSSSSTVKPIGLPIAREIRDEGTARQIAELLLQTSRVEPTQSATLRPEGGGLARGEAVDEPALRHLLHPGADRGRKRPEPEDPEIPERES